MTKPPELPRPATAPFPTISVSLSPPNAMATATVDSTTSAPADDVSNHLHFPLIDLRLLSQSELYSLSLSTTSIAPSSQDDDVLIPKIDRSVFNESAGSRKQTFSRLRLAPRNNPNHFSRQNPNPSPIFSDPQPLQQEDSLIISLLKQLFAVNAPEHSSPSTDIANETDLVSVPVQVQFNESNVEINNINYAVHTVPIDVVSSGSLKRKRGRPRKNEGLQVEIFKSEGERESYNDNVVSDDYNEDNERKAMGIVPIDGVELGLKKRKRGRPKKNEKKVEVLESERNEDDVVYVENEIECEREMGLENAKGVVVDLEGLSKMEDPFEDVLRRWTEGLRSEEELLGFLTGLEGEWASWRKRRKVVDAGALGDALPRGWKVVVRLKKKGDQICLGCSRYISPDRKQFLSCKDVSLYLVSYFSIPTSQGTSGLGHDKQHIAGKTTIENDKNPTFKEDQSQSEIVGQSPLPVSSITIDHQNHALLSESRPTEMLQGDESFRCHKCTMAFHEKDSFLYHLLSSHKKSKKSKNGPQGCEQVILRDGKYECQVCHKIFEQKSGYDGHMGNHIKDYVKRVGRGPSANYNGSDYRANTPHANTKVSTLAHSSLDNPVINLLRVEEVTTVVNNNEQSVSGYSERQETISRLFGDGLDTVTEGSNVIDTEGNVCPSGLNSLSDNQNEDTHEISGKPVVFGGSSYVEDHDKRVNSMVDLVENVEEEDLEEKSKVSNNYSIGVAELDAAVITMDEASGNNLNSGEDEASGNMQETETGTCAIPSCNEGTSDPKENKNGCLTSAKDQLLHNSVSLVDRVQVLGSIGNDGNIDEMKKSFLESLEKGDGQSFPSTCEQTFLADNGEAGNSKLDDTENGRNTKGLSLGGRIHDDKDDKIACKQKQELKHEETTSPFSCKRSDAFDSGYYGCDGEVTVRSEQNSNAEARSKIFPGCITNAAEQLTFGVVEENENKDSVLSPCHNKYSEGIDYKLDFIHLDTVHEGQGAANAEIPTKDGVVSGFCSGLKHHQDSVADFTWRTGEIVLQNDLDDIPSSVLPPSNSFHGMGAVSSKDENEYYGSKGKVSIHSLFDDVKFGDEAPSENNILRPSPSQSAPPEASTYNQEVEQGFHSNWFEKEALPLLPKVDGSLQITASCVWCGNEFNQQDDFQIEAGSLGYMCSSCKAKFSGHTNFL